MSKVDLDKEYTFEEIRDIIKDMLESKQRMDILIRYKSEPPLTKKDFEVTSNSFEVESNLWDKVERKCSSFSVKTKFICLALFIAFLFIFPTILFEDGWIFAIPLFLIAIEPFINKERADSKPSHAIGCISIVLPILAIMTIFIVPEGERTTSDAITFTATMTYVVFAVLGWIIPRLFASKEKMLEKMKSESDYKSQMSAARMRDEEETAEAYHAYIIEQEGWLNKADAIESKWAELSELYDWWKGKAELAMILYDEVLASKTVDQVIAELLGWSWFYSKKTFNQFADYAFEKADFHNKKRIEANECLESCAASLAEIIDKIYNH